MAYLTRFEDFYKSSDEESDEEGDKFGGLRYGPPPTAVEVSVEEQLVLSDDEDEGVESGMLVDPEDTDWTPQDRDWVPQSLVDLKLRIKAGGKNNVSRGQDARRDKRAEREEEEEGGERLFSNDYEEVCKYKCGLCEEEVDTDRMKAHMTAQHQGDQDEDDVRQGYDRKTWHRCGLCGTEVVFTRVRLRYHVVTEHDLNIQDYNEKFMVMKGKKKRRQISGESKNRSRIGWEEEFIKTEHDNLGDVDINDISEAEISNDYADLVKVDCRICTKHVEQDNFRFVHLKKHGIDLDDYRRSYGEPEVVRLVYHRCQICEQIFLFTRSRLGGHLSRHKISVKDYGKKFLTKVKGERRAVSMVVRQNEIDKDCMFSNDYEDECATVCKICTRSLNYGNLGSHLYQSHGTKMRGYVEKFGEAEISRKSYHECAICHETLLFIRYHLTLHVKTKHGMSINTYNKAHMQLHNVEYSDSNLTDKGRKIGTQKAPQWCDGTMYKCPYCFNVYYRYFTFRIHLINSHKMTDTEERSACVRENEILTDVYRCRVCRIQVKRDRMDIEAHLKQAHKTTLKVYSANFENGTMFGEDGAETIASVIIRLVSEGLMEEPSDRMFKTPKKVKKQPVRVKRETQGGEEDCSSTGGEEDKTGGEEDKTGGEEERLLGSSPSPVKEEEPKDEVDVKLEVPAEEEEGGGELGRRGGGELGLGKRKRKLPSRYITEEEEHTNNSGSPKQARLSPPSRLAGSTLKHTLPKASPTVLKSSPIKSRLVQASPLAPRSPNTSHLPPRAAKLSHSLVSVPQPKPQEVVVNEDPEVVVKKEPGAGDVIYRCPLDSCSWTCGKEGMRQGPAVLHLLRIHKIQPREMRLRGIKFEKIPV